MYKNRKIYADVNISDNLKLRFCSYEQKNDKQVFYLGFGKKGLLDFRISNDINQTIAILDNLIEKLMILVIKLRKESDNNSSNDQSNRL